MSRLLKENVTLKQEAPPKKAYVAPRLAEHGSLAKLTRAVKTTGTSDGGGKGIKP